MYDKVLDTFIIVAETGSFTKAAEKLYITHTAVRKQINQLEANLGVNLFDRSKQ
ncbi:MAG: LysR family transcriptional regulator, partial [Eubacteriales bacterium]|nr:LysR family transcriptional regulator [Eubacteriales bacterium]